MNNKDLLKALFFLCHSKNMFDQVYFKGNEYYHLGRNNPLLNDDPLLQAGLKVKYLLKGKVYVK